MLAPLYCMECVLPIPYSNTYFRAGATVAGNTRESGKLLSRLQSLARRNVGHDLSAASLHYHAASKGGGEASERRGSFSAER